MCPAVGVSLQELAIGAASRSTVARFLIDARRRDGVMTQCVGRLGLKQLPMPVDVPTCRIPDDCIDPKRYPLFMARAVLQELIESLQSTRGVKSC